MAKVKNPLLCEQLYDVHHHCVNLAKHEIYLHSYITDTTEEFEPGVEYRQATMFIKNVHIVNEDNPDNILVHMHSVGGCWDNGMAMFHTIELSKAPVVILAYSQASSMTGIIFQSAKRRIMMPDSHFLMHHGTVPAIEIHPFALKSEVDRQMFACNRMLQIFAERAMVGEYFKKKNADVKSAFKFFDKKVKDTVDWIISAEEAVYYGLADGILGSKEFPDMESIRAGITNGKQRVRSKAKGKAR